jgi:hypothetical protein
MLSENISVYLTMPWQLQRLKKDVMDTNSDIRANVTVKACHDPVRPKFVERLSMSSSYKLTHGTIFYY